MTIAFICLPKILGSIRKGVTSTARCRPILLGDSKQDAPIEFDAKKTGEKMAGLLGKYAAKLAVAAEE